MDPINQDQQPITPPEPQATPPAPQPAPITPVEPVAPSVQTVPPAPQPTYASSAVPQPQGPVFNPASMGSTPPMPGSGNSKKGLIIGLIAGGVGLLVVLITVAVIVATMNVSREDYAAAAKQYSEVSRSKLALSTKLLTLQYAGTGASTDTTISNDIKAGRDAISAVKSENKKLGELKAVKVGEGKEKYKAFNEKIEAYTKFADNFFTSADKARDVFKACGDSDSVSKADQLRAAISACVDALDKTGDLPDSDLNEYIGKLKQEFQKLQAAINELATISDPYGKQYDQFKKIRDQVRGVQENVNNASKDFRSNMEKHIEEVDPSGAAKDLTEFLYKKAAFK